MLHFSSTFPAQLCFFSSLESLELNAVTRLEILYTTAVTAVGLKYNTLQLETATEEIFDVPFCLLLA